MKLGHRDHRAQRHEEQARLHGHDGDARSPACWRLSMQVAHWHTVAFFGPGTRQPTHTLPNRDCGKGISAKWCNTGSSGADVSEGQKAHRLTAVPSVSSLLTGKFNGGARSRYVWSKEQVPPWVKEGGRRGRCVRKRRRRRWLTLNCPRIAA